MEAGEMLFLSLVLAWVVTVSLLFFVRPIAIGAGLVDQPGGRKIHDGAVPVFGGIAMFVGVLTGVLLQQHAYSELFGVVLPSFLLLLMGVADDRFPIPAPPRILVQTFAVLLMAFGGGFVLSDMGDPFGTGIITTGPFALPFTLLVTIATINAFNYVDGVDGLAGSLALVAFLSIAIVAGPGNTFGAEALIAAAAVFGFLIFNFPVAWNRPVRTFMGDAGSTLLGFSIVWMMIGVCQGPERLISPVIGLWFAALPIFDFFTCFVRRILKKKSPFTPGRDHVHHVLHRGGYTMRQRVAILAGMQAAYSVIGLAGYYAGAPDVVMFTAWSVLGLSQVSIVRFIASRGRLRRISRAQTAIKAVP